MIGEERHTKLLNWANRKLEEISNMKSPKKNLLALLVWVLIIGGAAAAISVVAVVIMTYARFLGTLARAFGDAFAAASPNVRVFVFGVLVIYFAHMIFFRRKPAAAVESKPTLLGHVTVAINTDILREPRPRVTINMKDTPAQITEASGVEYLTFNVPRASLAKDNAVLVRLGP